MKLYLVIIITLGTYLEIFAQTSIYHKFPVSNAYWNESSGGYQCDCCSDYQYKISGDTIVNSILYRKLWINGVNYWPDLLSQFCSPNISGYIDEYAGAYREDTLAQKVYYLPSGASSDTLLYDFTVNVGDTLPLSYTVVVSNSVVTSIDSILIDNNYRKRIEISADVGLNVFWIEGIGSTFGLLTTLEVQFEHYINLVCFIEDGLTIYPNVTYPCDSIVSIEERLSEPEIIISPNPALDRIRIQVPENLIVKSVQVCNVMGQIVISQKGLGLNSVNITHLPSGIYLLKMLTSAGLLTGKLVIR